MFSLLRRAMHRSGGGSVLRSPSENISLDFAQLEAQATGSARALAELGLRPGGMLLCDLGNVAQNVVLQLACSRLGAAFTSAKDSGGLLEAGSATMERGASIVAVGASPELAVALPGYTFASAKDIAVRAESAVFDLPEDSFDAAATTPHAFFNSKSPLTNGMLEEQGRDAAKQLAVGAEDVICISITLCHAFGAASAICSSLVGGAAIVLPGVAGTTGCGKPSDRAAATAKVLTDEKCSLLFCDTHTLKALQPFASHGFPALRGGVCKTGSGVDFLQETVPFAGLNLRTLGKHK